MSDPTGLINVQVLLGLKISTYISVSSTAFLVFDYLLMLSSEIQYVWQVNWGIGKVLYFLSRYPLLVVSPIRLYWVTSHVVSRTECRALYWLSGCAWMFAMIIAEILLAIRVWALWHRRIWVAVTLVCITGIGGTITGLIDVVTTLQGLTYVSDSMIVSLSNPACLAVGGDHRTTIVSYIILMVNMTVVFVLMVLAWFRSSYDGIRFSAMMYTFYKDGFVYFAALFAISIVNTAVGLAASLAYSNLLLPIQAALHSVLSTRMLLNLRQSAHRDLNGVNSILDPNTHREGGVTSLRFAAGTGDSAGAA